MLVTAMHTMPYIASAHIVSGSGIKYTAKYDNVIHTSAIAKSKKYLPAYLSVEIS